MLSAQKLGVPLFCALNTVTMSAQELGVNYNVLCETKSVSHASKNMMPAQGLGVPLLYTRNSDAVTISARNMGLNHSASYEIELDIASLKVSERHLLLGSTTKSSSPSDCWFLYFGLQGHSDDGKVYLVGVDHHNIGVHIVTCVSHLLTLFFRSFCYVLHVLILLLKYLYVKLYWLLTFFTPHGKWWPQYLYRLNLLVIHSCFTLHQTVTEKCRRVKASLLRNLFRHHDFLVVRASMCRVHRFTSIFIIASCLPPMFVSAHTPLVTVVSNPGEIHPDLPSWEHVGGGRIPLFNLEELLPHVDCSGKVVAPESNL
jgi:hypothetical protein